MSLIKFLWFGFTTLIIIKQALSFLHTHKSWKSCPYPLDSCLFTLELSIYLSLLQLLTINFSLDLQGCHRISLLIFLPLTQTLILIFCILSTIWSILIIYSKESCVFPI